MILDKILFKILIVFSLLLFSLSCKKQSNFIVEGRTMGTTYSINIFDYKVDSSNLKNKIDSLLNVLNMQMSTYIDSSEISKFNTGKKGSFSVSEDFIKVVDKSIGFHKYSDRYDITIKPIVDVWGFGKNEKQTIPDSVEILNLLNFIGIDNISIKNNKIIKREDEIQIDLSSIAKGYAVDKIFEMLKKLSFSDFLVEIGGEVRVSGLNNKKKWVLGISNPINEQLYKKIILNDVSIATSGTYNNYFTVENIDYSHLINPQTGYPIHHRVKSVSVVADNCIDADAFATLIILNSNPYKAIDIIDKISSVEAMILVLDNDNHIIEILSKNFDKYFMN